MTTTTPASDATNDTFLTDEEELIVDANYQFFIISLALLQLINSLLIIIVKRPEKTVVVSFFLLISLILISDASRRILRLRRHRVRGHKVNALLVLLGSLPIPFVVLVRLAASYAMFKGMQRSDFTEIGHVVVKRRAETTLLIAIFAAIVVVEAGSTMVLGAEAKSASANIINANDAIWWSLVTVATVGYGDQYPVTTAGRVVGVLIMIVGVGLFSVLTSYFAHWFLRASSSDNDSPDQGVTRADYEALMNRLDALTALVEQRTTEKQSGAPAPFDLPDNQGE